MQRDFASDRRYESDDNTSVKKTTRVFLLYDLQNHIEDLTSKEIKDNDQASVGCTVSRDG